MQKWLISLFLLFISLTPVSAQYLAHHSFDLSLIIIQFESDTSGFFISAGYSYAFENGLIIGTSTPVILCSQEKFEVIVTPIPLPSLLIGFGDRFSAFAASAEMRIYGDINSFNVNLYYQNGMFSLGWVGLNIFSKANAISIGGGYGFHIL